MAEGEFSVVYDGPALEDGRMEVRQLAPALLALADLVQEVNSTISPHAEPVALEFRATERGSFIVHLVLRILDDPGLTSLFSSDAVTALVNIKTLVIDPAVGIFALIKTLRGRRIMRSAPLPAGLVRIELDDGTTLEIRQELLAVHRNPLVRRRAWDVIEPLLEPDIDLLRFEDNGVPQVEIRAEEADAFAANEPTVEAITTSTVRMAVTIASVSFTPGNKWRLSDGDRIFYASMEDQEFRERIDSGERFGKGDILICEFVVEVTRTEAGGLHTEYTVTHVMDHSPADPPRSTGDLFDSA